MDKKRAEYPYPYGSIIKEYMQWNMMENVESDGVDKVIAYSNHRWEGVEAQNVKVVPRPYIVWMEKYDGIGRAISLARSVLMTTIPRAQADILIRHSLNA